MWGDWVQPQCVMVSGIVWVDKIASRWRLLNAEISFKNYINHCIVLPESNNTIRNCSNFLLSFAAILNLSLYTQKIPEPLRRQCRRCHVYYLQLILMNKVLNERTPPIGSSNPPSPSPSHSYPELRIPDCWRYTICLWLAAICEVCFPKLWSTIN